MSRTIEVIQSVDDIEPLTDLWSSPSPEALGPDWKIPEEVKMGLASQNPQKIERVSSFLEQHGSGLTIFVSVPEEALKEILRRRGDDIGIKDSRVANLAALKSLFAYHGESAATHFFALDTDVMVLGDFQNGPGEPVGRSGNKIELIQMLKLISGKTLVIKTAAALADVKENRILAVEEARILLKLRKFRIEEYLETIGTGLIGKIPGAIDFADPNVSVFLDQDFTVQVSRMIAHSEQDTRKLVMVDPKAVSAVLGDYFRGYPAHLINWVIYNGLKAKFFQNFPL